MTLTLIMYSTLLYSKFADLNVNCILKNTFTAESRLVFSQTSGPHNLSKLTYKFNNQSCRHPYNNQGNNNLQENHIHHGDFHNIRYFKNTALEFFDIPLTEKLREVCLSVWLEPLTALQLHSKKVVSQEGVSEKHFKLHSQGKLHDIL